MTRQLPSWASRGSAKRRPRLTLPGDVVAALTAALLGKRPRNAPARTASVRELGARAEQPGQHLTLRLLGLRFEIEIVGSGNLSGLRQPFVLAANEQGALDYQLLRLAMPARLRPTMIAPSRALAKGRNVVVFTDEAPNSAVVGEFTEVAAGLASQHNVAIVPVGLVGTFKLTKILKLPITTRPKVSIRFGAPVYVRGRQLAEATAVLQSRVEELVHAEKQTWWAVERKRGSSAVPTEIPSAARWRRLWDQTEPTKEPRQRIWR